MCDREAAGKRGKLGGADQAEGKAGKAGRRGQGGRKSPENGAVRIRRKEKRGKRGGADQAEGKVCRQLCGGGEDKQNLRFVEHGEEWN